MKIANIYSHLNGLEFLLVHKPEQWKQIQSAIENIDANLYTKASSDKTKKGFKLYDQKAINKAFERELNPNGWKEMKVQYYVTGNQEIEKLIVKVRDKDTQKQIIEQSGNKALTTNNQVDFVKDRIAIEVQFGKYFSIAYDLHVKHTFFFLRDDIDVGIEIIPTRALMRKMDTGIGWYENEVANVIREGRSNPSVPIVIIGIEPEELFTDKFYDENVERIYQQSLIDQSDFVNPFNNKVMKYKPVVEDEEEQEQDCSE
jgi:hypothetical protein